MPREHIYNTIPPLSRLKLATNVLAELPVQADKFHVHSLEGTMASGLNKPHHLSKIGFNGIGCDGFDHGRLRVAFSLLSHLEITLMILPSSLSPSICRIRMSVQIS